MEGKAMEINKNERKTEIYLRFEQMKQHEMKYMNIKKNKYGTCNR